MPEVNRAATSPDEPPVVDSSSARIERVDQVAAAAADRLGEAEAEQPEPRRLACSERGSSPARSQSSRCGSDLAGRRRRRVSSRSCRRSGVSTMVTASRLRDVDDAGAQPLTERLGLRVVPGGRGDPLAEQPVDHEVQRAQVGQLVAVDRQRRRLGQQPLEPLDGEEAAQPGVARVRAGPDADVGVAALVAGARADQRAERHPPGRPGRSPRAPPGCGLGRRRVRRGAVGGAIAPGCRPGSTATCGTASCGTKAAREHAVRRGVAGRRGHVKPGIGRQRQLDRRRPRTPARPASGRCRADAVQQRARLLLTSASGWSVRASVNPARPCRRLGELRLDQRRLRLDVQAGQHERHRVAEAAEGVEPDLERRRRRAAADAGDPDPVRPVRGAARSCRTGSSRPARGTPARRSRRAAAR